jgi:Domain of unknown function (DUF4395)
MFSFPNPVNEKAARVVAGVVMVVALITLLTSAYWLLVPLTYGFWARVLTGPTLSPLGQFATRAAPRLGAPKYVPGPPKRFAQGMGAAITTAASILALAGATTATDVLLGMLVLAAGLESIFAICLGCHVFALLMRTGLVPDSICLECSDLYRRQVDTAAGRVDALDLDGDLVAEPNRFPAVRADEHRLELVEVPPVVPEAADRQ